MKIIQKMVGAGLGLLLLALLISGCRESSSHKGVNETIKMATSPPQIRETMVPAPIGPTVLVKSRYARGVFFAETRKDKIERFLCSSCHNQQVVQRENAQEIVHGNIKLVHGAVDDEGACETCHNLENRDYLASEANRTIDFDHSYQLCGQCHFSQEKDWAGGAHGKRVANWEGKRVVKNCTGCHSPHSPKFEKRWPATSSIADGLTF